MNVHHLELFFHVAKNQGISRAVRNMPYGIQQPAVSGQLLQLEKSVGVKLFNRRPFSLTPAGERLYQFIIPFFSNLSEMSGKLRNELGQHLRLAAAAAVLKDYLPDLLQRMRRTHSRLKLTLREANPNQVEALLRNQEIDLAITVFEGKPPLGFQSVQLLRLPLVLLVEKKMLYKSAGDLLKTSKSPSETLIALPSYEPLWKLFDQELNRRKIQWIPRIEVNSMDLIQTYVSKGFGVGLSVAIPRTRLPANIRSIPLKGFPPLVVWALWQGKLSPLAGSFLEETQKIAKSLVSDPKTVD